MARVTNLKWKPPKRGDWRIGYPMDNLMKELCDAIVRRTNEKDQDATILLDGTEGSGKTNAAICLAYYIAEQSKREFNVDHVFFDLDEMIKFAGTTKEQIIIWDEAALGGLASDWTSKSQRKLIAMLMVCRKKKHIFIFNIPRFFRLALGIIERILCLVHIYEDDYENEGNFVLIGRQGLESLYYDWKNKRYARYFQFKKGSPGHFPYIKPYAINNDLYEAKKDKAIAKLANQDMDKKKEKELEKRNARLRRYIAKGFKNIEIAELEGVTSRTIREWVKDMEEGEI